MKKIKGSISIPSISWFKEYEFFVEDDATKEEIEQKIEENCQVFKNYSVEEGYKKRVITEYYK